jgi:hypothetical protein
VLSVRNKVLQVALLSILAYFESISHSYTHLHSNLMTCPIRFGYGGFELTYDGEIMASYSSFGAQVALQLGEGCEGL